MSISKEDVVERLSLAKTVKNVTLNKLDPGDFTHRLVCFDLGAIRYSLEWWVNICYLNTPEGLIIPFHNMRYSNTWPNATYNLQFYIDGRDTPVAIMPV